MVTFSHEPAVGFAADGYARATRRLGVICVTYGAGGHNIVNPIAAAYAERVPLLVISGGPGAEEARRSNIHHMVKSIDSQQRVLSEVTCDARILRHPERAAEEIHELLCNVMRELRPGYLEIHRDQVELEIPVPEWIREWNGAIPRPSSDPRRLAEALRDVIERLRRAERPMLIAGVDLHRVGAHGDFLRLAEKLECAVATTMLAKGVFPMDHPLHLGIQIGPFGAPAIQKRVADADLVIELGTQHTDINLGRAPEIAPAERTRVGRARARVDLVPPVPGRDAARARARARRRGAPVLPREGRVRRQPRAHAVRGERGRSCSRPTTSWSR